MWAPWEHFPPILFTAAFPVAGTLTGPQHRMQEQEVSIIHFPVWNSHSDPSNIWLHLFNYTEASPGSPCSLVCPAIGLTLCLCMCCTTGLGTPPSIPLPACLTPTHALKLSLHIISSGNIPWTPPAMTQSALLYSVTYFPCSAPSLLLLETSYSRCLLQRESSLRRRPVCCSLLSPCLV